MADSRAAGKAPDLTTATNEAEEEEEEVEAATTPSTSTSSSKKKRKKKLSALKNKLAPKASTSANNDALPDDVYQHIVNHVKTNEGEETAKQVTPEMAATILRALKLDDYAKGKSGIGGKHKKDMADHKFWATQPVPKLGSAHASTDLRTVDEGAIEADKTSDAISKEPIPLLKEFMWVDVDLSDDAQLEETRDLLTHHYVEDDDAGFRFDYLGPFLRWALMPPGYISSLHVGIRVKSSKKLVAFISGIPLDIRVREQIKKCSDINFLCVHKKLRGKRLAPVLIKEVTRRSHLVGIFQGVYTGGIFIPTPVARCQYFHRIINTKKLVDVGFTSVPPGLTLGRIMARNKLPDTIAIPGFREMEERDLPQVAPLLRRYLARYDMSPVWNDDELRHNIWSGRGTGEMVKGRRKDQVVWSFVVEEPASGRITDFVSFYTLPSTALKVTPHQIVDAAYVMYYATESIPTTTTSWQQEVLSDRERLSKRLIELMRDVLVTARDAGFDVFNCLTLGDNTLFIEEHKFGAGDGFLHYYLYNWQVRPIAGGCGGEATLPLEGQDKRKPAEDQPVVGGRVFGSGVGVIMM